MTAKEFIDSKEWTQDTVHFSISDVVDLMQEYTCIKCLEAIKNVRHKACDMVDIESYYSENGTLQVNVQDVIRQIQNIPEQDVMPEL